MSVRRGVGMALLVVVPVAGCGTGMRSEVVRSTSSTVLSPAAEGTPEDGVARIGGSAHRYPDGVAVLVSKAVKVTRQASAAGGRSTWPVVLVTVRVKNGAKDRLDLSMMSVGLRYGSDGEASESVFQDGVTGGTSATNAVGAGRSVSWTYAFSVPRDGLGAVEVGVSPGIDYQEALFEGSVKA